MLETRNDTDLSYHVLKTLLYFDIFSYPLTATEVHKFLRIKCCSPADVSHCLEALVIKHHVFNFGELYSLHPDENNILRRLRGNAAAEKWLKVAERKARFIGRFPFVRAVMASGSLSKGYMDENSDLDFFVITAANRLWIARTLLVLYKRIFLFNSHKQFCLNYFVDSRHLEIEEKNIFTATELATLIPLFNYPYYAAVLDRNSWVKDVFPNFEPRPEIERKTASPTYSKRVSEYLLHGVSGWLDSMFMRVTLRRWNRIYGKQYSKEDFDVAFKTRRYVSKNHPNHYQQKVLELYENKVLEFKKRLPQLTAYE